MYDQTKLYFQEKYKIKQIYTIGLLNDGSKGTITKLLSDILNILN